jgi:hypothetical protein
MAVPIRLITTAYALVTIALRGHLVIQVTATVVAREISDDGEHAILVDATGCRWALPIQPPPERSA